MFLDVNVTAYSPANKDIPVSSVGITIYNPGIGTHSFHSLIWGEFSALFAAKISHHNFSIPPGSCWVTEKAWSEKLSHLLYTWLPVELNSRPLASSNVLSTWLRAPILVLLIILLVLPIFILWIQMPKEYFNMHCTGINLVKS